LQQEPFDQYNVDVDLSIFPFALVGFKFEFSEGHLTWFIGMIVPAKSVAISFHENVSVDVYDGDDDDDDDPPRAWTSKTCIPVLLCNNMQQKDDDYNASTHSQRSRTKSSFD